MRVFKILSKKCIILVVAFIFVFLPLFVLKTNAYVSVKGYYRKNGTYVQPYVRSNPNGLKYDNYSYKSGDDLYNKTYGTKGSTWDTPTYITDPNYYEGKGLYESKNSTYSSPSTPSSSYSSSYSSPTYSTENNCPINATYDNSKSSCVCNAGYVAKDSQCVLGGFFCWEKYGLNSNYNASSNACECSSGYVFDSSTSQCISGLSYCQQKYGSSATYNAPTNVCNYYNTPPVLSDNDEKSQTELNRSDNPLGLVVGWLIKNKKFAEVFYVNSDLSLGWVINENIAQNRYGSDWNKNIHEFDDIPGIYKFGGNIK